MGRSKVEHFIEECAELAELLAQAQFQALRDKKRLRDTFKKMEKEWEDVRKTYERLAD